MNSHHSKHAFPVLWDVDVRVNIIQIPPEALTAQLFSKFSPLGHVPKRLLETKMTNHSVTILSQFHAFALKDHTSANSCHCPFVNRLNKTDPFFPK